MARPRSAESPRARSKTAVIEEITQGIATFHNILTAIEDFSREGFPYRDGARAKAELQIRETVRRLFGERSTEYQAHRTHKLKISTPAETTQSVLLIKSFIAALERKKLELQGLTPPAPDAGQSSAPLPQPQMTLVPPATPSAQITMAQPAARNTPPVTMSVAITTNLRQPSAPVPPAPPVTPPPAVESAAPVQPPAPPIPTSHLEPARVCAMPQEPQQPAAAPTPFHETADPPAAATRQEPAILHPLEPASPPHATAPMPPPAPVVPVVPSKPATPPIEPARPNLTHAEPGGPVASAPTPAIVSPTQSQPDPLDALRKVCLRFHAVARQLRLRKDYRTTLEVEDDYDLQDLLCAILKLEFDEVGAEEWTPPYTGGSPRTTLLLNKDRIAVVVKKTRSGLTTKELTEQVAADATQYASRTPCTHLFCFIYDPEGRIGSPTRLESDLTSVSDHFTIHVLVTPK